MILGGLGILVALVFYALWAMVRRRPPQTEEARAKDYAMLVDLAIRKGKSPDQVIHDAEAMMSWMEKAREEGDKSKKTRVGGMPALFYIKI